MTSYSMDNSADQGGLLLKRQCWPRVSATWQLWRTVGGALSTIRWSSKALFWASGAFVHYLDSGPLLRTGGKGLMVKSGQFHVVKWTTKLEITQTARKRILVAQWLSSTCTLWPLIVYQIVSVVWTPQAAISVSLGFHQNTVSRGNAPQNSYSGQ